MIFDDNALYKHPELEALRSPEEYGADEMDARANGLSYVSLDGTIGCIVNGAGLSMATMDLIKYFGGSPANFLDVGGSSNPEKVLNALRIISEESPGHARSSSTYSAASRAATTSPGGSSWRGKSSTHPRSARDPPHRHEREGRPGAPFSGGNRRIRRPHRSGQGRRGAGGKGEGMSILIGKDTRIIVQGITGRDGSFHALSMREYGSKVVGGVTPGKGGQDVEGIPVFDTVAEAREKTGADCTVIFVPARFASAALHEAADARIPLVVCITEGIPVLEMIANIAYLSRHGCRLIGPNCPGLITPGGARRASCPGRIHKPGDIGVISRSGTLTYEVVWALTRAGMGQSTCVGVGGDPVIGTGFVELLRLFEADPGTAGVVLIGEIGGEDEERAAEFIRTLHAASRSRRSSRAARRRRRSAWGTQGPSSRAAAARRRRR